ncbi:MAG: DsbE family thiol:disulfide interchange protein [Acetobacteraceae bacterium]|jgi:cytochrome c biogenesis protein CcmG/thiol:disulfide interchange protein DsbE
MIRLLPRRALLLAPTGVAVLGGVALLALRGRLRQDSDQPLAPPAALLDRPVPAVSLPGLAAQPGFGGADITAAGRPVLVNFFASWCLPCQQEMPVLQRLARGGLAIGGIAFRDKPDDAAGFLRRNGDPYRWVGCDETGAAGNDFDLLGVPESFLVDRAGVVRWVWAGGLSDAVVSRYLDPLLRA